MGVCVHLLLTWHKSYMEPTSVYSNLLGLCVYFELQIAILNLTFKLYFIINR